MGRTTFIQSINLSGFNASTADGKLKRRPSLIIPYTTAGKSFIMNTTICVTIPKISRKFFPDFLGILDDREADIDSNEETSTNETMYK